MKNKKTSFKQVSRLSKNIRLKLIRDKMSNEELNNQPLGRKAFGMVTSEIHSCVLFLIFCRAFRVHIILG